MSRYWTRKNRIKNLIGLVLAPIVIFMLLRWFEHSQVYQPSKRDGASADALGRPAEDFWLETGDGVKINAWFFPAEDDAKRKDWVILFSHGNAGHLGNRLGTFDVLLRSGVNLLGYDYRGYGKSEGRPSEEGTYLDLLAAYRWLIDVKGFSPERIIAHGNSLGGGVTSWLPTQHPVAALILQSTFTSTPDIGKELFPWLPVHLISSIQYDTVNRVGDCGVPVLIIHGTNDSLIPFHHAERNFAAAVEPKFLWKLSGDHNDSLEDESVHYLRGLNQFLDFVIERDGQTGKVSASDE